MFQQCANTNDGLPMFCEHHGDRTLRYLGMTSFRYLMLCMNFLLLISRMFLNFISPCTSRFFLQTPLCTTFLSISKVKLSMCRATIFITGLTVACTLAILGVRAIKFSSFGNKTLFLYKRFLWFLATNMAAVQTIYACCTYNVDQCCTSNVAVFAYMVRVKSNMTFSLCVMFS